MSDIAPFQIPKSLPNSWDALLNTMNSYAGRGFPLQTVLGDATPTPWVAPSGTLWGTTNTSAFAANANNMTATTTVSATFNNIRAVPFYNRVGHGIKTMGLRVTTGVATAVAVFGIYDSIDDGRGNFYPGKKLWQGTGITPTVSNVSHEQTPNITLLPGRVYWAVYHGGVATPTLAAIAVGACSDLLGYSTGAGAPTLQTYLTGARTYSATLPSLYPSGQTAVATAPPLLYFRYEPSLMQTFTRVFPAFTPFDAGWVVRGAKLLVGTTKQSGNNNPSLTISARLRSASGAQVLGTFDTSTAKASPGTVYPLTGATNIDRDVPVGSSLEVYVEQTGWPLLTANDCAVFWNLARTGA